MTAPDFDWREDVECVVLPLQPRTAVYFNPQHTVVIRQESQLGGDEDDSIILVTPDNADAIAKALIATAGEARRQAMTDRCSEGSTTARVGPLLLQRSCASTIAPAVPIAAGASA